MATLCIVLQCTVLYGNIMYCTLLVLYCIVLFCTLQLLYSTVLHSYAKYCTEHLCFVLNSNIGMMVSDMYKVSFDHTVCFVTYLFIFI